MKKLRKLLVVTTLLMALAYVLPVGQNELVPDQGFNVCCDLPPGDVIGFF